MLAAELNGSLPQREQCHEVPDEVPEAAVQALCVEAGDAADSLESVLQPPAPLPPAMCTFDTEDSMMFPSCTVELNSDATHILVRSDSSVSVWDASTGALLRRDKLPQGRDMYSQARFADLRNGLHVVLCSSSFEGGAAFYLWPVYPVEVSAPAGAFCKLVDRNLLCRFVALLVKPGDQAPTDADGDTSPGSNPRPKDELWMVVDHFTSVVAWNVTAGAKAELRVPLSSQLLPPAATSSWATRLGIVNIPSVPPHHVLHKASHASTYTAADHCMAVSPRGDVLALASKDTHRVAFYSTTTWEPTGVETAEGYEHFQPVCSLAFSEDSSLLYSCANTAFVYVWCVATGCRLQELAAHRTELMLSALGTMALASVGSDTFVSVGIDERVYVWAQNDTCKLQEDRTQYSRFLIQDTFPSPVKGTIAASRPAPTAALLRVVTATAEGNVLVHDIPCTAPSMLTSMQHSAYPCIAPPDPATDDAEVDPSVLSMIAAHPALLLVKVLALMASIPLGIFQFVSLGSEAITSLTMQWTAAANWMALWKSIMSGFMFWHMLATLQCSQTAPCRLKEGMKREWLDTLWNRVLPRPAVRTSSTWHAYFSFVLEANIMSVIMMALLDAAVVFMNAFLILDCPEHTDVFVIINFIIAFSTQLVFTGLRLRSQVLNLVWPSKETGSMSRRMSKVGIAANATLFLFLLLCIIVPAGIGRGKSCYRITCTYTDYGGSEQKISTLLTRGAAPGNMPKLCHARLYQCSDDIPAARGKPTVVNPVCSGLTAAKNSTPLAASSYCIRYADDDRPLRQYVVSGREPFCLMEAVCLGSDPICVVDV